MRWFGLAGAVLAAALTGARAQDMGSMGAMGGSMGTGHMAGHMRLSTETPVKPGDWAKADAVAAAAKIAIAPYADYHKALAEGYQVFMPNLPQKMYHFTSYQNARLEYGHFDPLKPTSLLYEKTGDGYKLIGAMYTDRVNAPESELNSRIPLSIARWHQHVNFCQAPPGHNKEYFGPDAKFGLLGSITSKAECEAAGGSFRPDLFGWMVHVYPFETDRKEVWSTDRDDDEGAMRGARF